MLISFCKVIGGLRQVGLLQMVRHGPLIHGLPYLGKAVAKKETA